MSTEWNFKIFLTHRSTNKRISFNGQSFSQIAGFIEAGKLSDYNQIHLFGRLSDEGLFNDDTTLFDEFQALKYDLHTRAMFIQPLSNTEYQIGSFDNTGLMNNLEYGDQMRVYMSFLTIFSLPAPNTNAPPWKGFTRSDIDKFDTIFNPTSPENTSGNPPMQNVSACPVCLKYTERSAACNYMSHNCSASGYYHKKLYNKYKNDEGLIYWCTICGRICHGHSHYQLSSPNAPRPPLLPGLSPFAPDCRIDGGGGVDEKIMRFRAMRKKAIELQGEINRISDTTARNQLVETMWAAPLQKNTMNGERTHGQIAESIRTTGAFNIPLNALPNRLENTSATIESAPHGVFEAPEIIPVSEQTEERENLVNVISGMQGDPLIRFIHKNDAGDITRHTMFISKDSLIYSLEEIIPTKLYRCFEPACNGYLWPEEIAQALEHPDIAPTVTDEDRATLATYKERFYRNYIPPVGGKRRKMRGGDNQDVFQPVLNATCVLPPKPRGGKRKTHKRRRGRKVATRRARK